MSKHFLFGVLISLLVAHALSCSCLFQEFEERYERATTVLRVKVLSEKIFPAPSPPACLNSKPPCLPPIFFTEPVKYKLRLSRRFKGCPPKKIFFGRTTDNGASCGVRLTVGKTYLLFLGKETPDFGGHPDSFSINLCQQNLLFTEVTRSQRYFLFKNSKKPENQCLKK